MKKLWCWIFGCNVDLTHEPLQEIGPGAYEVLGNPRCPRCGQLFFRDRN